jgi:hypothetical protein
LSNFVKEIQKNKNKNILGKFRKAFGTFEKPLMNGFVGSDFVFFRPNLVEILNLE